MTYNYTDKQLNELNQDKNVYSVNETFSQDNNTKTIVSDDNIDPKNETNTIETSDGQQFRVIATESDPETGFDGMAVAPIINGQVDYSSVAVIAAGTDPNNKTVNPVDNPITGDPAVSRDFGTAVESSFSTISPQYQVADQFVQRVIEMEGVTVSQLSGYSQGAYMIKVGAKHHIPTTTFNAWFLYSSLTPEEADYIKKNSDKFVDYRRSFDDVVIFNDLNLPEFTGYKDFGTIYWQPGTSHKLEDWQFDKKTGKVIDNEGEIVNPTSYKPSTIDVRPAILGSLRPRINYFHSLLPKQGAALGQRVGGQIFLDSSLARALTMNFSKLGADFHQNLSQVAQQKLDEAHHLASSLSEIPSGITRLSPDEIEACYAEVGLTKAGITAEIEHMISEKLSQTEKTAQDLDKLSNDTNSGIDLMITKDIDLAGGIQVGQI